MKTYQRGKDSNDVMSMPIEVGGRNLILDSNNLKSWETYDSELIKYDYQGISDSILGNVGKKESILKVYLTHNISKELDIGENLSYSATVENLREFPITLRLNGLTNAEIVEIPANTSKRVVITGELGQNMIQTQIRAHLPSGYVHFKISDVKLEKGNIPTDWTPAPEDIEARFKALEEKVGL